VRPYSRTELAAPSGPSWSLVAVRPRPRETRHLEVTGCRECSGRNKRIPETRGDRSSAAHRRHPLERARRSFPDCVLSRFSFVHVFVVSASWYRSYLPLANVLRGRRENHPPRSNPSDAASTPRGLSTGIRQRASPRGGGTRRAGVRGHNAEKRRSLGAVETAPVPQATTRKTHTKARAHRRHRYRNGFLATNSHPRRRRVPRPRVASIRIARPARKRRTLTRTVPSQPRTCTSNVQVGRQPEEPREVSFGNRRCARLICARRTASSARRPRPRWSAVPGPFA